MKNKKGALKTPFSSTLYKTSTLLILLSEKVELLLLLIPIIMRSML